jgi:hypothetical protein
MNKLEEHNIKRFNKWAGSIQLLVDDNIHEELKQDILP